MNTGGGEGQAAAVVGNNRGRAGNNAVGGIGRDAGELAPVTDEVLRRQASRHRNVASCGKARRIGGAANMREATGYFRANAQPLDVVAERAGDGGYA